MSKNPTVLIVDDDRDITAGARIRLMASGYSVLLAHDGREAVRMAVEHRPGVILLDICMPSPDGLKTLAWLRQQAETQDIPIIIFSVDCNQARQTLMLRAEHYVRKPYRAEDLLAAIESVILENADTRLKSATLPGRLSDASPSRWLADSDIGTSLHSVAKLCNRQSMRTRVDKGHPIETTPETLPAARPCSARLLKPVKA